MESRFWDHAGSVKVTTWKSRSSARELPWDKPQPSKPRVKGRGSAARRPQASRAPMWEGETAGAVRGESEDR